MSKKYESLIPRDDCHSIMLQWDVERTARSFVQRLFELRPLLRRCGLWDSEILKRYLHYDGTSEIVYKDFIRLNPERAKLVRDMILIDDSAISDFWSPIREDGCKILDASDPRFEFSDLMPYAPDTLRDKALRCISVDENANIAVSEHRAKEESYLEPTEEQRELYASAASFCALLKNKGIKKNLRMLFYNDKDGYLCPNTVGIIFGHMSPIR